MRVKQLARLVNTSQIVAGATALTRKSRNRAFTLVGRKYLAAISPRLQIRQICPPLIALMHYNPGRRRKPWNRAVGVNRATRAGMQAPRASFLIPSFHRRKRDPRNKRVRYLSSLQVSRNARRLLYQPLGSSSPSSLIEMSIYRDFSIVCKE